MKIRNKLSSNTIVLDRKKDNNFLICLKKCELVIKTKEKGDLTSISIKEYTN